MNEMDYLNMELSPMLREYNEDIIDIIYCRRMNDGCELCKFKQKCAETIKDALKGLEKDCNAL